MAGMGGCAAGRLVAAAGVAAWALFAAAGVAAGPLVAAALVVAGPLVAAALVVASGVLRVGGVGRGGGGGGGRCLNLGDLPGAGGAWFGLGAQDCRQRQKQRHETF
jgi:hypothetical protein